MAENLDEQNGHLRAQVLRLRNQLGKTVSMLKAQKKESYRLHLVGPRYSGYAEAILAIQAKYDTLQAKHNELQAKHLEIHTKHRDTRSAHHEELKHLHSQWQDAYQSLQSTIQGEVEQQLASKVGNFQKTISGLEALYYRLLDDYKKLETFMSTPNADIMIWAWPHDAFEQIMAYAVRNVELELQFDDQHNTIVSLESQNVQIQDENDRLRSQMDIVDEQDYVNQIQNLKKKLEEKDTEIQALKRHVPLPHDSQPDHDEDATPEPRYVQRILACRRCKGRYNCDGQNPCGHCKTAGRPCSFEVCRPYQNSGDCPNGIQCHKIHGKNDDYEHYPV